jgi:uncharacterized protein DUF5916/cellulose/xylan binding protein with CBM9 domain
MFRGLVSSRFALFLALASVVPVVAAGQQPQRPLAASISTARSAAPPPVTEIPEGSASMSPDDRRTMEAVRMSADEKIALDGMLDEGVWMRAVPATNFIQRDPDTGQKATESTEVRIVYDGDTLYMGVTCFDSEPERLIANQMARDGNLFGDDQFQWVFDTFLDGRTGYFFEMNPRGAMGDALQGADFSSRNRQWDGIWDARAHISEIGWTLEVEIPFRTLNFDPKSDRWGINFQRSIRHKNNEESVWMGWPRNQGLNRMSNTALLTGIRDVSQGRGLDIKPYVLGTSESFPGQGDSRVTNDATAGLDVFYSVTPSLRANLTVNTDFAQAEVDQRQVNLTRFSLLFPEKRDFFLDGALFFDFASANIGGNFEGANNADVLPFFTRSIGLDTQGNPQRIDFGGKLLGQVGAFDMGVLQVHTGQAGAAFGEDFLVGRVKRRMLRQSYIGALYTLRDTRGGDVVNRQTIGTDFRFATSTFRQRQNLSLSGYFLHTTNPLDTGKSDAFGAELSYPNDPVYSSLEYQEVQDNYNPAVGFLRRTGFRKVQPRLGFQLRPRNDWVRRYDFRGEVDWRVDPETNRTLTREVDLKAFDLFTNSQDRIQVHILPTYDSLQEDFEIATGITLPIGHDYTFTRYRLDGNTADRRIVSVRPLIEWGNFYSGDRRELRLDVTLRPRPGLLFTVAGEQNRVRLAEGAFTTRLYRFVTETELNPLISLVNNIQYDSQSSVLGWQSRFRWIIKPGNDLYFVYINNWQDDPLSHRMYTLERRATSKISYTHRF